MGRRLDRGATRLRALGQAIAVRVRDGHLHALHRGVYGVGHDNPPLEGRFLAAVRQAQSLRLVRLPQLVEAVRRLGPRRGVRILTRVLATGPAPTRSELEDAVLDLMLAGGLAHPQVNVPIVIGGRRIIPDFRWPEQRLVVEADGAAWHDNGLSREDDAERQALLEAH